MPVIRLEAAGSVLISSAVNTVCCCVVTTSTRGAALVTVNVSCTWPTVIVTSTGATNAPVSTMPSRTTVRNPGSVKATE